MSKFFIKGALYLLAFVLTRIVLSGLLGITSGQSVETTAGALSFFVAGMFGHLAASGFDYVTGLLDRHVDDQDDINVTM